jgi:acetate kinase
MTGKALCRLRSKSLAQANRSIFLSCDPKRRDPSFPLSTPDSVNTMDRSDGTHGWRLKSREPAKILVINCGSSSIKYCFHDTADEGRPARGMVERIGLPGMRLAHEGPCGAVKRELSPGGFAEGLGAMVAELTATSTGVIRTVGEITLVAHRVVHGGEHFAEATLVTDEVLAQIEALNPLAPLHNPVNAAGIREMRRLFPAASHVAVFDTAFHHTLPARAYLYGLPYDLYKKWGVRRYGFHGTSHAYASLRAAQFLGRPATELALVICHLGNGSSLCAVHQGRSVDTTMGFTPGEGLIMGTRCGDLDAAIVTFLQRSEGLSPADIDELLNKKSGLLGLSGLSSDIRDVLEAANAGHPQASLAIDAYCYRVRKYIGAYVAAMAGVDAIVFTGGIGQGRAAVRARVLQGLHSMGIALDEELNRTARGFDEVCRISTEASKVSVLVVPADEERMMAIEALAALARADGTGRVGSRDTGH